MRFKYNYFNKLFQDLDQDIIITTISCPKCFYFRACLLDWNILKPPSCLENCYYHTFSLTFYSSMHTRTQHNHCHLLFSKEPFLSCIHVAEISSCLPITQYSLFLYQQNLYIDGWETCSATKTRFQISFGTNVSQWNIHRMWMTQQKSRSLCTVIMPILLMKKLRLREVVHLAPKLEVSLTAKMIFSPLSYTTFIRPSSHYSSLFMSFIIQDNN